MKTPRSNACPELPTQTLLADYDRWLAFVTASRQTIRQYDTELARLGKRYNDLRALIRYLRRRMHRRSQIFGKLAIQLTGQVAQLRADPTNVPLIQRMTRRYPAMKSLIGQLANVLAVTETLYWTLLNQLLANRKATTCLTQ